MNPCVIPATPTDVGDGRWMSMHERFVQEARNSEAEVVFIGDSIIEYLRFASLWTDKINALHCLNFGIGGDRVEHVLWRLQNGELDFSVKMSAVVLFVGTNNTNCAPREVFEGIVNLVRVVRAKHDVPIVIPTLLPKGQFPNRGREKNDEVNMYLLDRFGGGGEIKDEFAGDVHVVRVDENVVQNDGTISHHDMYDYLHLTNAGYTKFFGPVYEKLCVLLKK